MSEKQPEALRLADELVETPFQSTGYIAAAELRRLHEVNQELLEAARRVLKWVEAEEDHTKEPDFWPRVQMYRNAVLATRAAIAKNERRCHCSGNSHAAS